MKTNKNERGKLQWRLLTQQRFFYEKDLNGRDLKLVNLDLDLYVGRLLI